MSRSHTQPSIESEAQSPRRPSSLHSLLSLITLPGLLVGCPGMPGVEPEIRAIEAANQTEMTLTFLMQVEGREIPLHGPVEPDRMGRIIYDIGESSTVIGQDGCTLGDIVAYNPDGLEVARRPPPLCVGETWVVEDIEPTPS